MADALFWKVVSRNLAWRPRSDAERGRGSGSCRARTRDGVSSSTWPNCIRGWARGRHQRPAWPARRNFDRLWRRSSSQGVRIDAGVLHRLARGARGGDAGSGKRAGSHRRSFGASRSQVEHRCSTLASCIACAAKSCSSAIPPILLPPRKPSRPPSPSRRSKARAAHVCWRRCRSPSSINRPAARRRPRRPRARARRLFADARNAGDR